RVRPAALPPDAFQHQRSWLHAAAPGRSADPAEAGFWHVVERGDLPAFASELGVDSVAADTVLPALSTWRARGEVRSLFDGCRYRVTWKRVADPGAARVDGSLLLLGDVEDETAAQAVGRTGRGAGAGV
ncbi:hypothetical protein, partial [Streptomyces sp. BE303]|uniref:hypothetical protein n=1 Tax=Streptomyces sp. BE303 TaxID=3002528 RepID=UPI002E79F3AD